MDNPFAAYEAAGGTLPTLAKESGIARSYLIELKRGTKTAPSMKMALAIERATKGLVPFAIWRTRLERAA